MNYQETVEYLYSALPMFSRIGSDAIKKDLTNTILLCEGLGNPQQKFKTIHVAGTNGKGSVSHMLAAILQQNGYKTGLYTSPHLYDFRERIKVNGEMIPASFVVAFTENIKPAIEKIQPSFFEITVAMAFDFFASADVDVAVIETGLGGRLDSTNIIHPEVSVITNIGLDHMNILGDTIPAIAKEKAGIIKKGTPCVIGEFVEETAPVFEATAINQNAPLTYASRHMYCDAYQFKKNKLEVGIVKNSEKRTYHLDLTGFYQIKNLVTVLTTVDALKQSGWNLVSQQTEKALQQVKKLTGLHGRWEVIHENPTVVLDVGHNKDGIKQICEQLELTDYHNLHIILGMVRDKDIQSVLTLLPKEATYYFTKAQIPRALPEDQLAAQATAFELEGHTYIDVNKAMAAAMTSAAQDDLILVCGSFFVIAELDRI